MERPSRRVSSILAWCLVLAGCTSSRQAWITAGVSASAAVVAGAIAASPQAAQCARRGVLGCPAEYGGVFVVGAGGVVAVSSVIAAVVLGRAERATPGARVRALIDDGIAAGRRRDCATVQAIDPRVRELDRQLHATKYRVNVFVRACLP